MSTQNRAGLANISASVAFIGVFSCMGPLVRNQSLLALHGFGTEPTDVLPGSVDALMDHVASLVGSNIATSRALLGRIFWVRLCLVSSQIDAVGEDESTELANPLVDLSLMHLSIVFLQ